jgi:outer membrane protein OmpA-like peptidoglycan-associated protein
MQRHNITAVDSGLSLKIEKEKHFMLKNRTTIVASLIAVCLLAATWAFGQSGSKAEAQGMIISRTGETLIVKTSDGGKTTVVLTDATKVQDRRGLFGLDKQQLADTILMPGLKLKAKGTTDDQGRIVAKTIMTDGDDIETAEMIEAGLHPTAEQVAANVVTLEKHSQKISANTTDIEGNKMDIAANKQDISAASQQIQQNINDIQENVQRFAALSEYDVKGEANVKFNVGSSKLAPADEEQLKQLAQTATGLKGYIVEVTGFADSTGSAAMNTKLSEDRAKAVITYLMQQGGIPIRHIVAPGAMGEYGEAASNETKDGRADNRRVEVKVLVNKGIAGS